MNQVRILQFTNLIGDLEKDQLKITNDLLQETDDGEKKDMMKQLSAVVTLLKGLTAYNTKFLDPPEKPIKIPKSEKVVKQVYQYNIKGLIK